MKFSEVFPDDVMQNNANISVINLQTVVESICLVRGIISIFVNDDRGINGWMM